jgi:hypothetical protein
MTAALRAEARRTGMPGGCRAESPNYDSPG